MAKSVEIVCGHGLSTDGTFDVGATYNGKTEAALMLPITQAFVKYARLSGITVYTDVDAGENNNMNMTKSVQEANNRKVDAYVSIHCDWYKAPTGTLPLYVSAEGKRLAECLNKYLVASGISTRGVAKRTDLYELNKTNMPACIFECGSIKADMDNWDTAAEADAYGKALARGLCTYLGVPFKDTSETKPVVKPAVSGVDYSKKAASKVVTASIKTIGKGYMLAPHFTLGEFQCHNGADAVKYDIQIINALEAARQFFGVPITISSAYRTADYNKKIGGASGSYHTKGRAVDHYCKLSYTLLAKFYEVYGLKGIGCYYDDHFCHIDSRDSKFLWKNQSSTKVSTHLVTVRKGNDNQHVNDLQWLLKNKHGFTTLKVDGDFGTKTDTAVKSFQKKHGLTVDGIVGAKTWKKLLAA